MQTRASSRMNITVLFARSPQIRSFVNSYANAGNGAIRGSWQLATRRIAAGLTSRRRPDGVRDGRDDAARVG